MSSSSSAAGAGAPYASSQASKGSRRSRSRSRVRSVDNYMSRRGVPRMRRAYRSVRASPEFAPTPWPSSYKCVLRFQQSTPIVGATPQALRFRSNDCYDPYYETGGAQPRGFDQLCASGGPYQRFLVHKTVFTFTVWNQTTNIPVQWKMLGCNNVGVIGAWNTADEQALLSSREYVSSPYNVAGGTVTASKFTIHPRKLIGVSKGEYQDVISYGGAYNASPAQTAICQFIVNTMDNTSAVSCIVKTEMEIYVEFSDAELLPAS